MYNPVEHLQFLKNIPQYDQKKAEWYEQRKNKLTSSDVATALGVNPYKKPIELFFEKCHASSKVFEGNENTLHGQKYEDEAIKKYEFLTGRKNHVFGMISFSDLNEIREKRETSRKYIDKKYEFLGGSPDGISIDKNADGNSVLMQTEVKCPLKRKIKHGQIPGHYFPQVQMNMFILDLEVTDFIEYIPSEIGKNEELNVVRLFRDEEWFEKSFPILEKFWSDVQYWRTRNIKEHPEYQKFFPQKAEPVKSLFIDDGTKRPSKDNEESDNEESDSEERSIEDANESLFD